MFNLFKHLIGNSFQFTKSVFRVKRLAKISNQLAINSMMSSLNVKTIGLKETEEKTLLKSINDKLDYKYIVLNNGLKALLVSDPTHSEVTTAPEEVNNSDISETDGSSDDDLTDVSSCDEKDEPIDGKAIRYKMNKMPKKPTNEKLSAFAVVVRTGSFADPQQVQGLAHLVEHVLTMGSKEYPEENTLEDYLTSRGGYSNAHTDYEYTIYEVEVQKKHMLGALSRLAHCFIAPLLRMDSIEREIKPVDTEFIEALPDDDVRLEQILNGMANSGHPFNAFPWGNALSLKTIPEKNGTNTQKCVKEFYNKHYFSDNIHVVIQSQETIETLEKWITELFGQIRPSDASNEIETSRPVDTPVETPFHNNPNFNKLYFVEPVNEADQFIVYWCLPPVLQYYKTSPLDYLGNIIGHEGKGSLVSLLRRENLALELCGGIDDSGFANNKYSSIFQISVKLTELGNKNIDKVVEYVFEYLNVLQRVGPQEWFFDELQNIENNRFNWQEEQNAAIYTQKLAKNLVHFPYKYVLCGNKLYLEYNKQLIESYLNLLTPTNACFVRLSSNILNDEKEVKIEPWFGTKYKINEIPDKWLSYKSSKSADAFGLHFPNPNPYIATEFQIKNSSAENDYPMKELDKKRVKLWYKSDDKFKLPKAIIKLHLISPHFWQSVESAVMTDLFIEILNQNLSEEVYDATLAGLYWSLSQTTTGLVLSVNGFNHKLNVLLLAIIDKMINFQIEDKVFRDVKKNLSKGYHNSFIDPSNLNKSLRLTILSQKFFNAIQRRHCLNSIDKEMLKEFVRKYFTDFYIEALIQGNLTKEESNQLIDEIEAKLRLDSKAEPIAEPEMTTSEIPIGSNFCRVLSLSPTNKTSSITNYYQLNPADIYLQCQLTVLSSLMDEPCFSILRTKEGLGYYVYATDYDTYGISGFGVSVNSSGLEFDCSFVDQRIENFITQMVEILKNMTEEKFKDHINSIITSKRIPDLQLKEEFTRNWNEIISFNYCFNRLDKEIKCLEKMTFDEFKKWSIDNILTNNEKKRKLSVQIVGFGSKSLAECLTCDGNALDSGEQSYVQQSNETEDPEQSFKRFRLTYLKAKNLSNNRNNFIEDIDRYKERLNIYPTHKVVE